MKKQTIYSSPECAVNSMPETDMVLCASEFGGSVVEDVTVADTYEW